MNAGEYLPTLANMVTVQGTCEKHGNLAVTIKTNMAWYCPACLDEELRSDYDTKWAEKRNADLYAVAMIPDRYRGEKFEAKTAQQMLVKGTTKAFRDAITKGSCWAALILTGEFGTGKTLLACELASGLIEKFGLAVRYLTAEQMVGEVQASYGSEGKSRESELLRMAQFDLLIIDEIDAKRGSEDSNAILTEVINRRYNAEKPVVVITNQSFDDLKKFVGGRVHSRLHENAFFCLFDWQDARKVA